MAFEFPVRNTFVHFDDDSEDDCELVRKILSEPQPPLSARCSWFFEVRTRTSHTAVGARMGPGAQMESCLETSDERDSSSQDTEAPRSRGSSFASEAGAASGSEGEGGACPRPQLSEEEGDGEEGAAPARAGVRFSMPEAAAELTDAAAVDSDDDAAPTPRLSGGLAQVSMASSAAPPQEPLRAAPCVWAPLVPVLHCCWPPAAGCGQAPQGPAPTSSRWSVDARAFEGEQKLVELLPFCVALPGQGACPFQVVLYADVKPSRGRSDSTGFRRTRGRGRVEVRCLAQLWAGAGRASVSVKAVGAGARVRLPMEHDFAVQRCCHQRRWDFRAAAEAGTLTLIVKIAPMWCSIPALIAQC